VKTVSAAVVIVVFAVVVVVLRTMFMSNTDLIATNKE
jgi:hypothetical protein